MGSGGRGAAVGETASVSKADMIRERKREGVSGTAING
jgi:hypothetical protein